MKNIRNKKIELIDKGDESHIFTVDYTLESHKTYMEFQGHRGKSEKKFRIQLRLSAAQTNSAFYSQPIAEGKLGPNTDKEISDLPIVQAGEVTVLAFTAQVVNAEKKWMDKTKKQQDVSGFKKILLILLFLTAIGTVVEYMYRKAKKSKKKTGKTTKKINRKIKKEKPKKSLSALAKMEKDADGLMQIKRKQIKKKDPKLEKAEIEAQIKQYVNKAVGIYGELIDEYSYRPQIISGKLARAYQILGELDKARKVLLKANKQWSKDNLLELYFEIFIQQRDDYLLSNQFKKALLLFQEANGLLKEYPFELMFDYPPNKRRVLKFCGLSLQKMMAQTRLLSQSTSDADKKKAKTGDGKILEYLNKLVKKDPEYAEAYYFQGIYWMEKSDLPKALKNSSRAIHFQNTLPPFYYLRGDIRYRAKNYLQALSNFKKAIRINRRYLEAYVYRGDCYNKIDQFKKALKDYADALEIDSKYIPAYLKLGDSWLRKKNLLKAIENYAQAIEIQNSPKISKEYLTYYKTFQAGANELKITLNKIQASYYRGLVWFGLKNYPKALEDFTLAIQKGPTFAGAYLMLGKIWYQRMNFPVAIREFNQAIREDGKFSAAYFARSLAYFQSEKFQKALDDYIEAVKIQIPSQEPITEEIQIEMLKKFYNPSHPPKSAYLLKILSFPGDNFKLQVLHYFRTPPSEVAPQVVKYLQSPNPVFQNEVLIILKTRGKRKHCSLIFPFLKNEIVDIRKNALEALQKISGQKFGLDPLKSPQTQQGALAKWKGWIGKIGR